MSDITTTASAMVNLAAFRIATIGAGHAAFNHPQLI
jgi:hypothetical protein